MKQLNEGVNDSSPLVREATFYLIGELYAIL